MPVWENSNQIRLSDAVITLHPSLSIKKTYNELQYKREYIITPTLQKTTILQNVNIGSNLITHNLNLSDPRGFVLKALDSATNNTVVISNFTGFTPDSFTFTSSVNIANVHFTII